MADRIQSSARPCPGVGAVSPGRAIGVVARGAVAALAAVAFWVSNAGAEAGMAHESEFAAALSAFFSANGAILPVPRPGKFPVNVLEATSRPGSAADYDALVRIGLVLRRSEMPGQLIWSNRSRTVDFDLTAIGRALFQPADDAGARVPAGFRAGEIHLLSVERSTKPIDLKGREMAQVTFAAQIDMAAWTRNPALHADFAGRLAESGKRSGVVELELTDAGWVVASAPEFSEHVE